MGKCACVHVIVIRMRALTFLLLNRWACVSLRVRCAYVSVSFIPTTLSYPCMYIWMENMRNWLSQSTHRRTKCSHTHIACSIGMKSAERKLPRQHIKYSRAAALPNAYVFLCSFVWCAEKLLRNQPTGGHVYDVYGRRVRVAR